MSDLVLRLRALAKKSHDAGTASMRPSPFETARLLTEAADALDHAPAVKKWDYVTKPLVEIFTERELNDFLDKIGDEGWELAAKVPVKIKGDNGWAADCLVFKREKKHA